MTEDTRTGRAMPPSRVHQLGRMSRPALLGHYMQLRTTTSTQLSEAVSRWSTDRLIDQIITLETTPYPPGAGSEEDM